MTNGFLKINERDWENLTPERRDWIIFNTLNSMDQRLQTLENRPFWDKCMSFLGGIVGGVAAALGIKIGM